MDLSKIDFKALRHRFGESKQKNTDFTLALNLRHGRFKAKIHPLE